MTTIGWAPPSNRPPATAMASPSRQTRIRRKSGSALRAGSQVPSSLSGIQTTCVMPQLLSAVTTEGPSSMIGSTRTSGTDRAWSAPLGMVGWSTLHGPVARMARPATRHAQLAVGSQDGLLVLLLRRIVQGLGVVGVDLGQLGP